MAGGIALQSAATSAGNGTAFNFRGHSGVFGFSCEPAGTITAGAVQFESAPSADYAGTWVPIGAEVTLATGVLAAFSVVGNFHAVRARITSAVTGTGGSVTARVSPPAIPDGD